MGVIVFSFKMYLGRKGFEGYKPNADVDMGQKDIRVGRDKVDCNNSFMC